jgi:hypothetical protein
MYSVIVHPSSKNQCNLNFQNFKKERRLYNKSFFSKILLNINTHIEIPLLTKKGVSYGY